MISVETIRTKSQKIWDSQIIQRAILTRESLFPLTISITKPTAKILQQDFVQLRTLITNLRNISKEITGYGYQIAFKKIQHRQLGQQSIPDYIYFEQLDDFLQFTGKRQEYIKYCQIIGVIIEQQPSLKSWALTHTLDITSYHNKWPQLLRVCHFFQHCHKPDCFLRELDIPEVDSKFIEQHKKILSQLLDHLLPQQAINNDIETLSGQGFAMRYGLKYDEQLIRFRILDPTIITQYHGISDLSIPLSEFHQLSISCQQVFITENKINGLSFPPMENSIIIFGLGYGVHSLRNIAWLKNKTIIYWGDIDTHGFAILSQLRSYYHQTHSFLMDMTTLEKFKHLCVEEPEDSTCKATLNNLTTNEQFLYQLLRQNETGKTIRLEQERISYHYLTEQLTTIQHN